MEIWDDWRVHPTRETSNDPPPRLEVNPQDYDFLNQGLHSTYDQQENILKPVKYAER